jgi:predicted ArsR family transcriptional regulator
VDFVKILVYIVLAMPVRSKKTTAVVRTRRALLHILKEEGAMDAGALAERLRVSAMAVRQHLYALHDEKLVTYQERRQPLGRPAKLWQLTAAADRLFPDGYAELTLSMLTSVREAFGTAGLARLLELRTRDQIALYRRRVPERGALPVRVEALAAIRTDEGYMASSRPQPDGSVLLFENHCPICAAAVACTGLCAKELEVFQAVLGPKVSIERAEHIVAGARRCAYRVVSQGRGGRRRP